MKNGFVYILQSQKSKKYYIGSTDNLPRRLEEHNLGFGGVYSNRNTPWELVRYKEVASIKDARDLEKKVKAYKGGNAFKKIIRGEVPEWPKGAAC
ncbi:MAG: GIY-YIG nuclease family protein [Candidatus Omnitrophica bacterium]|nr:GIY-YIG nuclease family protein [Candidatus Omnitrophota bacterium]